jgi:hypothetical protein
MRTAKNKATIMFGTAELEAANLFVEAGLRQKQATKDREESKAQLVEALGDLNVGILPDGRTVRRTSTEFPEATFNRKAYTATMLTID